MGPSHLKPEVHPSGGMNLLNSTPVLLGLYPDESVRHLDLAMVLDPEQPRDTSQLHWKAKFLLSAEHRESSGKGYGSLFYLSHNAQAVSHGACCCHSLGNCSIAGASGQWSLSTCSCYVLGAAANATETPAMGPDFCFTLVLCKNRSQPDKLGTGRSSYIFRQTFFF